MHEAHPAPLPARRKEAGRVGSLMQINWSSLFVPGLPVAELLVRGSAIFIGGVGAVSVIKAVYIDRCELKCACVGGSTNVPLGFVSLTENLFMVGVALWMLVR